MGSSGTERRVSTRPAESGTEQSKTDVGIELKLMLCDVGSSGAAGVAAIAAGKGAEPPENERSLKHQLEASRVPGAGLEPARL